MKKKDHISWLNKVVDLVVVIIGITIAFALNECQQNSNTEVLQKKYLISLMIDLEKDLKLIREDMATLDTLDRKTRASLHFAQSESKKSDSLNYYFEGISSQTTFHPNDHTFGSIVNSGNITHFSDVDFMRELTELYNGHYRQIKELDEFGLRNLQDNVVGYFVNSPYDDKYFKSQSFINLVQVIRSINHQKRTSYEKADQQIDRLLKQIQKKIDS